MAKMQNTVLSSENYSLPSDSLSSESPSDILVFSHLRWDLVFQRPQHLLTRFARINRVFYIEEPIFDESTVAYCEKNVRERGRLTTITPHLPASLMSQDKQIQEQLKSEIDNLITELQSTSYICWYYTPMALPFTRHLKPVATVYDCMDELAAFQGAPPSLLQLERELFKRSDLVYTGGQNLYEHKKSLHHNVHLFPSSIDESHFKRARSLTLEPRDQACFEGNAKVGYAGVIDERMDLALVDDVAAMRPDWNFIFLGPVVKISKNSLPRRDNIHFLGAKAYSDLPKYLSAWDAGLIPFARNESTRFISPTKTPEYLAAGLPVVSTSITDVIRTYLPPKLVRIADDAPAFVEAIELSILDNKDPLWFDKVDAFLAQNSWEKTWRSMATLLKELENEMMDRKVVAIERFSPETVRATLLQQDQE